MKVKEMTREQKIKFLLEGEKELAPRMNYTNKFGDFSEVSNESLTDMVKELDWLWK